MASVSFLRLIVLTVSVFAFISSAAPAAVGPSEASVPVENIDSQNKETYDSGDMIKQAYAPPVTTENDQTSATQMPQAKNISTDAHHDKKKLTVSGKDTNNEKSNDTAIEVAGNLTPAESRDTLFLKGTLPAKNEGPLKNIPQEVDSNAISWPYVSKRQDWDDHHAKTSWIPRDIYADEESSEAVPRIRNHGTSVDERVAKDIYRGMEVTEPNPVVSHGGNNETEPTPGMRRDYDFQSRMLQRHVVEGVEEVMRTLRGAKTVNVQIPIIMGGNVYITGAQIQDTVSGWAHRASCADLPKCF